MTGESEKLDFKHDENFRPTIGIEQVNGSAEVSNGSLTEVHYNINAKIP